MALLKFLTHSDIFDKDRLPSRDVNMLERASWSECEMYSCYTKWGPLLSALLEKVTAEALA